MEKQECQFRRNFFKFFIHDSSPRINIDRKFKEALAKKGHSCFRSQDIDQAREREFCCTWQLIDRLLHCAKNRGNLQDCALAKERLSDGGNRMEFPRI